MEIEIQYEPSEFKVIETFEFEEQVQTPEELRFFSLEEQLEDFFQKSVPKKKHVLKAEYAKIKKEVDRLRVIYNDVIKLTDTYHIDDKRKSVNVDWLKPIYGSFKYEPYSYKDKYIPLFDESKRRVPNYYPILVNALPRPYGSEGASGVPITESTELVDDKGEHPIHALGPFTRTKRFVKDDGTEEFKDIPFPNTGDDVRRIGFYIEERPLNIPHPLPGHKILSSSKANIIETAEPLLDIFPSIESIVSHAVPVTKDPYVEGQKYLKLYDVSLSQIRWNSWKERFPPVDTVRTPKTPLELSFPTNDIVAPSEKLQGVYESKWRKGMEPRMWLMKQEDGGRLVTKMLLSDSGNFGVIAADLMHEKPKVQLPESSPEECLKTDNFEEFLSSGLYRLDGKVCAPTPFVTQERKEFINLNKKAWMDTTGPSIQKDHVTLLKIYQPPKHEEKEEKYEKTKNKETSELRQNIITILGNDTLLPPDQSYEIRLLIKEITPVNEQYFDADGLFLICKHTLAILDGEMNNDTKLFYEKWTEIVDAYRVCKFCSQQINKDTAEFQEDFDDNGRLLVSYDVLTTTQAVHGTSKFVTTLAQLREVFNKKNAGHTVVYFLLSAFQVIPDEQELMLFLNYVIRASNSAVASGKLDKKGVNFYEGVFGIAAMIGLLQTHNPFLIPRRSFGTKVVKLSGFPRDTDNSKDAPALDICLTALHDLHDLSPSGFTEPFDTIITEVVNNRKKVRDEVVRALLNLKKQFPAQFETAKERFAKVEKEVEENDIHIPILVPDKKQFKIGERQKEEQQTRCEIPKLRNVIVSKRVPKYSQTFPDLIGTKPSKEAKYIEPQEVDIDYVFPDEKQIQKMVGMKFPDKLKLDPIKNFIENSDGVSLTTLLTRLLDIVSVLDFPHAKMAALRQFVDSVDSFKNKSLFRDAVKGTLYVFFHEIRGEDKLIDAIRTAMKRDITMNMLLLTKEESTKVVELLTTKERETVKYRLQQLSDREREVTKMLLDIGIAQYIFTEADRRLIAKDFPVLTEIADDDVNPEDVPEGGFTNRGLIDDGDEQMNEKGQLIEPDRGDYGDLADRPFDEYSRETYFDEAED